MRNSRGEADLGAQRRDHEGPRVELPTGTLQFLFFIHRATLNDTPLLSLLEPHVHGACSVGTQWIHVGLCRIESSWED